MVKITLPEDNEQILAARYQMYLPTEEELRAELARERDEAERVLRLTAAARGTAKAVGETTVVAKSDARGTANRRRAPKRVPASPRPRRR